MRLVQLVMLWSARYATTNKLTLFFVFFIFFCVTNILLLLFTGDEDICVANIQELCKGISKECVDKILWTKI